MADRTISESGRPFKGIPRLACYQSLADVLDSVESNGAARGVTVSVLHQGSE